jgi:peptidoglycan hydrolase-like protein with peptidoglycan-binding domain
MNTSRLAAAVAIAIALGAMPAVAQSGADIERVQKALKDSGHDPGPIDGVSGPRTAAALKAYQKAQGLEATGRLDDATLAKLGGAKRTPSTTQSGGDTRPSPADPAQATKTGANVGEGASYSRSNQK